MLLYLLKFDYKTTWANHAFLHVSFVDVWMFISVNCMRGKLWNRYSKVCVYGYLFHGHSKCYSWVPIHQSWAFVPLKVIIVMVSWSKSTPLFIKG